MSLEHQLKRGVKWVSLAKVLRIVFQYITLLILAKLLEPADFGLMSTAMIFIGFLYIIKDLGLATAIIQTDLLDDVLLSSIFYFNIAIGIILACTLFLSSSYIANFYHQEMLMPIIKVLSLNFIFTTISSVPNAIVERNMEFNLVSKIEITCSFIGSTVAIILALYNFGVWALVIQSLAFSFFSMCLYLIYSKFIPRLFFKYSRIKEVLNFGLNLSGFNILNFFVRNADYFLIGKFIGMDVLGYYSLAYKIMLFPIQNITSVVNRVLYPTLSKVKNDLKRTRDIYLKVIQAISFFTFPLMLGFWAVTNEFVKVFFESKWYSIIELLYVMIPIGLIQSVYTLAGSIFQSQNKTDLWLKWGIVSATITVGGFYVGLRWGVVGVALSYLITNLILIYPGSIIPFNLIKLNFHTFLNSMKKNFIISCIMFLGVLFFNEILFKEVNIVLNLILSIFSGIIFYVILSYLFNKDLIIKFVRREGIV